ncbi:DUF3025 domain-containing protein [Thiobacter aerophilum]|uniref:DUF3025 domain-containing protein n=1 Tax=Thiobacter aerophilum TaxID=3121275 RepID=A0ABV0EIA6_9BURK
MHTPWNPQRLQGPLFASLATVLARLPWPAGRWPNYPQYQALLDGLPMPVMSGLGVPLRVSAPLAAGPDWQTGYEARIAREGLLPTRLQNWHDLFNLLVWVAFPRSKAALNRCHYRLQEARAQRGEGGRTPAEQALAQFDESGVIIVAADAELLSLMRAFRWKALFWQKRARVQTHMACYLFGHGLMEKALAPFVGMTGKGVVVEVSAEFFRLRLTEQLARLDGIVAAVVPQLTSPADLQPVPVLGFPGFTSANDEPTYYDNLAYFRPGRRRDRAAPT